MERKEMWGRIGWIVTSPLWGPLFIVWFIFLVIWVNTYHPDSYQSPFTKTKEKDND